MSSYKSSNGVTINFTPWFDSGYRFTELHIVEELGGKIPGGTMKLELDGSKESLDLLLNQYTGLITLEDENTGAIYNIDIFITSREFFNNILNISFVCIKDKKFFTELLSSTWNDITKAITSIYPGKTDIRVESDVNNNIELFQNCETNYDFCKRLAYSYKHNIVFSFGFEGFMLKEIIGKSDSKGNMEPSIKLLGGNTITNSTPYNLNYNKKIYNIPSNPWEDFEDATTKKDYTDKQAINCRTISSYSDYLIVRTEYYRLVDNYLYNKRFMECNMFTSFRTVSTSIPEYKIGDTVYYNRVDQESKYPFEIFLIAGNELFYSIDGNDSVDKNGLNFSWTSKLLGLEENGELLPLKDPTDK